MKGSKLLELYASLSNLERKHFASFVVSPFFNRKEELIHLATYLRAQAPGFSLESLTKESIFQAIAPGLPYKDQTFRLLCSELSDLLNRFLAYQAFTAMGNLEEVLLLRNLGKRNLDKHFQYTLRKTRKLQERQRATDSDHHLKRYLLEEEVGQYMRRNPRSQETNLQATIDQLDIFYLIEKLKSACSILNNQNVVDLEHDILFLDAILTHLNVHTYEAYPLVSIYYQALKMFLEPDEAIHFHELRTLLARYHQDIPNEEASDAYTFAQNHCIRQINRGRSEYMEDLFKIYQELLAQELIFDQGQLSPWHYKNIVVLGLRLKAFVWVEEFIEDYRDRIPTEFRDNAFTYNLAKLRFHQREYPAVKRLLQQVEYEDLFYNLDSKVMLLKIYLEEDEQDALESLTNTFIIYLDRNKLLSEDHRLRYRNLVKYVRRLNQIGNDSLKLVKLQAEVDEVGKVADIGWLREVIELRMADLS